MSEELKAAQARIACLEGEIAKRDETIARLEPQLNRAIQANYDLREELAACRVAVENCEVFRARIAELEARIVWLECEAQVNAAPVPEAKAQGLVMLSRDAIREVFMRNGFTVKEGQADLKPYVYAAAEELLRLFAPVQQVSVPDGKVCVPVEVLRLYEFMAASFTPFTSQHEQVAISLRKAKAAMLAAAPAAPAADAGLVLEQAMYALIGIGYHENSGLVHELRQSLAAHRAQGVV